MGASEAQWVGADGCTYILYNGLEGPQPPHGLGEVKTRIKNA